MTPAIFLTPAANTDYAYAMGYDAGVNGPNETNCHFNLFRSHEMTKAWERGKKVGDGERSAAPSVPSKEEK